MTTPDKRKLALFSAAVVLLLVLHNDWWNRSHGGAVLGWIPFDLVYHVAWVGLGAIVLSWIRRATWRRTP